MSPPERPNPWHRAPDAPGPPPRRDDDPAGPDPGGWTRVSVLTPGTAAALLLSVVAAVVLLGPPGADEEAAPKAATFSQEGDGCALAFAPDGTTLASVNNEGTVTLWDVRRRRSRGTAAARRRGHAVPPQPGHLPRRRRRWPSATPTRPSRSGTSPGGGSRRRSGPAASRSTRWPSPPTARRWRPPATRPSGSGTSPRGGRGPPCAGRVQGVLCVAFAADGRTIAAGDASGAVTLWEAATGRVRAVLRGHTAAVRSVAFAPDGATLATAGAERRPRRPALGGGLGPPAGPAAGP